MARLALRTAFVALGLLFSAEAQIRVMAPDWLKKDMQNMGNIEGSTATFGAPFYGDDVVGRLVYAEPNDKDSPHCTEDGYDIPPAETEERGASKYQAVKLINIVLVRRGKCSFTTKVKVAYKKGAHAVIIVDREDSSMTAADLKRIIVGDDGYGDSIHIPSILVTKQDGNKLIQAAQKTEVIVQLSWNIPADHIVGVDMWMSAGSTESMLFMKKFAPKRKALNEVMHFRPHYAVFSMPSSDPSVYQDLCSDTTGQYCAEDPDASGDLTGKAVLEEDVRQLCIHELTKVAKDVREEIAAEAAKAVDEANAKSKADGKKVSVPKMAQVVYAEPYWNYIEQLTDRCPITGTTDDARLGYTCSQKLMEELKIDTMKVNKCVMETKDEKLKDQRDHAAWSPRALRINGWRYTGMLDPDLVTRAICAGFVNKPPECLDLVQSRDPTAKYGGIPEEGVSMNTFVFGLLGLAVFSLGTLLCYKQALKSQVQSAVREEVMLEVQAAMATYNRLHNDA